MIGSNTKTNAESKGYKFIHFSNIIAMNQPIIGVDAVWAKNTLDSVLPHLFIALHLKTFD
jgi:hypothetical protein